MILFREKHLIFKKKEHFMQLKRHIEIFSAGCMVCQEGIQLVNRLAGSTHQVEVHDMHQAQIAQRATSLGIHSVPALLIDGQLASCCLGRGPDEAALRAAGLY
jgi:glutaredoxin 3